MGPNQAALNTWRAPMRMAESSKVSAAVASGSSAVFFSNTPNVIRTWAKRVDRVALIR